MFLGGLSELLTRQSPSLAWISPQAPFTAGHDCFSVAATESLTDGPSVRIRYDVQDDSNLRLLVLNIYIWRYEAGMPSQTFINLPMNYMKLFNL